MASRRQDLQQELRAVTAHVQQLESDRLAVQTDYIQVSRAAINEQTWRVTNSLISAVQNEVGTDVAVVTNRSLPDGVSYDFSKRTLFRCFEFN
jgi:predicted secreted hydrolase